MKKPASLGLTLLIALFFMGMVLSTLSIQNKTVSVQAQINNAESTPPHVILIIVDTLRIDHVSAYGYERQTTPFLDANIADEGVRFRAYTSSPWTCPSNAAIVTGRSPSVVGSTWETIGNSVPASEKTLAEFLDEAGYYTAGFTSGPYCVRGDLGFEQGFDIYLDDPDSNGPIRAEDLNGRVFDWLETTWTPTLSGTQPLFLYLYYFDPHTWYDPPPPYDTLYDPDYNGSLTPEMFGHGETAKSGKLILSADDLHYLTAMYDGEIAYWDDHFGQLWDELDIQGLLDDTLIIVTTDHGEMLGEHNEWSHAGSLYEEVIRIPLLMRYTGHISPSLNITASVQSMDLMPTILDFVGIQIPENIEAVSLRPYIESTVPLSVTRPIFSEVDKIEDPQNGLAWASPPDDLRSVNEDNWKYIYHLNRPNSSELYWLQPSSIYEINNVIEEEPEKTQELKATLLDQYFPFHVSLPFVSR